MLEAEAARATPRGSVYTMKKIGTHPYRVIALHDDGQRQGSPAADGWWLFCKPPTLVKTQRQPSAVHSPALAWCREFKLWAMMSVPAFVAVNASRKRAIKKWGASGTEAAATLKDLLTDSAFQRTLLVQLATRWREVGAHWLPGVVCGACGPCGALMLRGRRAAVAESWQSPHPSFM